IASRLRRLPPAVSDVLVAVAVHRFRAFGEIAPNLCGGGKVLQAAAEGFDGEPAVVAAPADPREGLSPWNVAAPGNATVVLGDVDVDDVLRMFGKGGDRIGLLDVGVEGVVH